MRRVGQVACQVNEAPALNPPPFTSHAFAEANRIPQDQRKPHPAGARRTYSVDRQLKNKSDPIPTTELMLR